VQRNPSCVLFRRNLSSALVPPHHTFSTPFVRLSPISLPPTRSGASYMADIHKRAPVGPDSADAGSEANLAAAGAQAESKRTASSQTRIQPRPPVDRAAREMVY